MSIRSVVIGTAGHIDHGKSALVRALTGTDPDRLKEEQERGITIDLGFAHAEAQGTVLSFVDVPGHERFVKNMLAGAGGIDLVALIVAADESVMPQTREHFDICRLLGVPAGVIVLTKTDIADADMQALAALEVRELTAGSFLEHAPLVRVSARTGAGLAALTAALVEQAAHVPRRASDRPARLPIDRAFTVKGFGTVVTGTLIAGELAEGDELVLMPGGRRVTARGLQVHGASRGAATAGQRVAVNLGGVDVSAVARGHTLCAPGSIDSTRRIDVAIELLPGAKPLRHGTRLKVHQGTTEVLGRVSIAGSRQPAEPTDATAPRAEIGAGRVGYARLRLEAPAVLTRGDCFILRACSPATTLGGGVVLDPQPSRAPIRSEAGRQRFEAFDIHAPDASRVVTALVRECGAAGLRRAALITRLGLAPTAAAAVALRLTAEGTVVAVEESLVATAEISRLSAALDTAIRAHHAEQPLGDGLPREEARERLFARAAPGLFEHVLASLVAAGGIVARDRLAVAGHQVSLTTEEAAAVDAIEARFKVSGLAPADPAAVATALGVPADVADRMVKLLVRRNRLIRVGGMLFHVEALEALKREVRSMKGETKAGVDVGTFKERYGLSRKYAIPLLEYLDRERVTRRAGASRVVL